MLMMLIYSIRSVSFIGRIEREREKEEREKERERGRVGTEIDAERNVMGRTEKHTDPLYLNNVWYVHHACMAST
jgi:hypothetical protein